MTARGRRRFPPAGRVRGATAPIRATRSVAKDRGEPTKADARAPSAASTRRTEDAGPVRVHPDAVRPGAVRTAEGRPDATSVGTPRGVGGADGSALGRGGLDGPDLRPDATSRGAPRVPDRRALRPKAGTRARGWDLRRRLVHPAAP